MTPEHEEKREFIRYTCEKPVIFKTILSPVHNNAAARLVVGMSKNLSASGILFKSEHLPDISSVLQLELDYRTTNICREVEENALILNEKLIGKVVRIEDTNDGMYYVGVAFIRKNDQLPKEIKDIIR